MINLVSGILNDKTLWVGMSGVGGFVLSLRSFTCTNKKLNPTFCSLCNSLFWFKITVLQAARAECRASFAGWMRGMM